MKKTILFILPLLMTAACMGRNTSPDIPALPIDTNENVLSDSGVTEPVWDADISMYEAEEYYSLGIHLLYEGYTQEAMEYLLVLIDKGVHDRYVYKTILEAYQDLIAAYQWGYYVELAEALERALAIGSDAITYFPDNIELLELNSDIIRSSGDYQAFEVSLFDILEKDPYSVYANYYIGALYYLSDMYDEAYSYLQTVTVYATYESDTDLYALFQAYEYLGMISFYQDNYEDTVYYFENAKLILPSDYELLQYLAIIYSQYLDFENAQENFDEIPLYNFSEELASVYAGVMVVNKEEERVSLNGLPLYDEEGMDYMLELFSGDSGFIKAVKEHIEGNYQASLDELETAGFNEFNLYYNNYLKYLNYQNLGMEEEKIIQAFLLGNHAKEVGQYDLAIEYFKMVEVNTNSIPDIYWLIGSLYDDSGDYSNALIYYEKYTSYEGDLEYLASALIRQSFMYYETDRMSESLEYLELAEAASETDYDSFLVGFYSGLMNFELREYDAALEDFFTALEYYPDNYQILYFIASTFLQIDDYSQAVVYLERAKETSPNSAEINNLLAYVYAIEGENLDEALTLINLALLMEPDNLSYLDTLGWIYYIRGEYDESFETFMRIEMEIDDVDYEFGIDEVYFHLGMIYEHFGDLDLAEEYYKMGFETNPENEEIIERLDDLDI